LNCSFRRVTLPDIGSLRPTTVAELPYDQNESSVNRVRRLSLIGWGFPFRAIRAVQRQSLSCL
jgi:hypothetical protein